MPASDPIRIGNSKPRYALLLLLSLGFVAGGVAILVHDARLHVQFAAWACVLFFGGCALVFARQLFDPRPRLVIDAAGVTDRTLGVGTIPWTDIADARLHRVGRQPFVGLGLRNEAQWLARLGPWHRRMARANRGAGFDAFNLNLSGVRADPDVVLALVRSHLSPATATEEKAGTDAEADAVGNAGAQSATRAATSAVQRAATRMRAGGVVAYPTEAVWGLGCDPANESAVMRLLAIKQREVAKGVILAAARVEQLAPYADLDALPPARREEVLASWPGPHTWIVPARADAPRWITGQHDGIAVRVSAHPVVVALCEAFGGAIVSTSANPAGAPPPTRLDAFDPELRAALDGVVEGATGGLGAPTPIRDARSGAVLRT